MTAALVWGEWSAACPGRILPPGKTRFPFYRRLGGPQGRSGRAENLVPTGIRSRTFQPAVNRYTDWDTRPVIVCLPECDVMNQFRSYHRPSAAINEAPHSKIIYTCLCAKNTTGKYQVFFFLFLKSKFFNIEHLNNNECSSETKLVDPY